MTPRALKEFKRDHMISKHVSNTPSRDTGQKMAGQKWTGQEVPARAITLLPYSLHNFASLSIFNPTWLPQAKSLGGFRHNVRGYLILSRP
jgi:hypothetical protein